MGPGSIGPVHFNYDAYGRRGNTVAGSAGMTDATGTQAYAYDDDDDLLTKTVTWTGVTGSKVLTYAYNPDGSRKTMSAAGRNFGYTYDGVGRVTVGVKNDANADHGLCLPGQRVAFDEDARQRRRHDLHPERPGPADRPGQQDGRRGRDLRLLGHGV